MTAVFSPTVKTLPFTLNSYFPHINYIVAFGVNVAVKIDRRNLERKESVLQVNINRGVIVIETYLDVKHFSPSSGRH